MSSAESKPLFKKPSIVYLWSLCPSQGFKVYCEDMEFVYFINRDASVFEVYQKESQSWCIPDGVMRRYPCCQMEKEKKD